jgi:hypothetical protein
MKKIVASGLAAALFAGTLGAFLVPALADDTTAVSGSAGAARISLVRGDVAVERSDTHDNVAAAVNAPVLNGDALTTGSQASAEVQFDGRSILRADENSQVRFANLNPDATVVQVAEGTIAVDLLDGSTLRPDIDTPSISVRPDGVGRYRVTVDGNGETFVTVRAGTADVVTPQGTQTIGIGATLTAQGPAANPSMNTQDAVAFDAFDTFNINRDADLDASLNSDQAYSSYDAQDLSAYGQWVNDPQYGEVWVPDNQNANWAPYRDGQWAWEGGYYGYTWISYEPWGWAPYHYGRWAHRGGGGGWCWIAPRQRSPWAPGLVAFFGFGSGGGLSIGLNFGNVGWVPLGPSDPDHQWWGGGDRRYPMVNSFASVNRYGNYRSGGATAVDAQRWKQGDFRHNAPIAPGQLHNVVAFDGHGTSLRPTPENMRFSQAKLPTVLANRRFNQVTFARGQAPAFARSIRTTPTVARSAPAISRTAGYGNTTPAARQTVRTRYAAPVAATRSNDPWTRFNDSRGIAGGQQTFSTTRTTQQQPTRRYQQQQPTQRYQQQQQPTRTYQQQQQPTQRYQAQQQPARTYQYQQQPTQRYQAQQQPAQRYQQQQQPTQRYQQQQAPRNQQPSRQAPARQQQSRGSNSSSNSHNNRRPPTA